MPTQECGIDAWHGLTKREYFAAAALQGLLANSEATSKALKSGIQDDLECITLDALSLADSLLCDLEEFANPEDTQ